MIITPDLIKALFTGFKKNYQDGLQMAKSAYYLRCLECGDLVRESEAESEPDPKPAKGGK